MGIISDGVNTYVVGPDGQKKYVSPEEISINDHPLYQFNAETGVLRVAGTEQVIADLREAYKTMASERVNIVLPSILGPVRFEGVSGIEAIANATPMMYAANEPLPQQKKTTVQPAAQDSLLRRIFGKEH